MCVCVSMWGYVCVTVSYIWLSGCAWHRNVHNSCNYVLSIIALQKSPETCTQYTAGRKTTCSFFTFGRNNACWQKKKKKNVGVDWNLLLADTTCITIAVDYIRFVHVAVCVCTIYLLSKVTPVSRKGQKKLPRPVDNDDSPAMVLKGQSAKSAAGS